MSAAGADRGWLHLMTPSVTMLAGMTDSTDVTVSPGIAAPPGLTRSSGGSGHSTIRRSAKRDRRLGTGGAVAVWLATCAAVSAAERIDHPLDIGLNLSGAGIDMAPFPPRGE